MAAAAAVWIPVLLLLQLVHCSIIHTHSAEDSVLLDDRSATAFLSRSLLYNSWDFEVVARDNLERECIEELCSYEEAREVFENDALTDDFWKEYTQGYAPKVDISGLVAGLLTLLGLAIIAAVLGVYCYRAKKKGDRRPGQAPVRMAQDGRPAPEMVPLAGIATAPAPPTYNEALNHSGQHDAPPPPYSGGAPSEPADPGDTA